MAPPPTSGFGSNAPPGSSECRGPCAGMVSTPSKRPSFLGSLSPLSPHSVGLTHSVSSVTASYTTVGQLKAGMWFGHRELLKGYDEYWNINPKQGEEQDENNGLAMTDVKWDLLYRCRTGCELLLLFKEDFWTLLDDIPTFRDLLEDQEDYGNLARASEVVHVPSAQEVPLRPTEVAVATAEDRGGAETPCAVRLSQATVSAVGIVGSSCELGGSTHEASPPLSPIICTSAPPMRRRRVPSTPRSPTCSASSGSPSSMVPMKKGGMMKGACMGGNKSSGLASMQSVQVFAKSTGKKGAGARARFANARGANMAGGGSLWGKVRDNLPSIVAAAMREDLVYFKQRLLVEILGQPLLPPWEVAGIDIITRLRERLPMATSAEGVVRSQLPTAPARRLITSEPSDASQPLMAPLPAPVIERRLERLDSCGV
eukprot:CAMPEP_0181174992 /NCGR_PEP_ID=MMETSP1096-20121128/3837_1 /TAXON_ID=156174 ORGANISM="Chrysochromulina ericina, Strain CCMP281" /NCGR_SAMPLE_ID=MMETSP1096 /ASSEMBLY_ACC=CAM_ASM_000453 /LENGTH=427 /DNA_ID=CAMNT_0023262941 /DNA_START=98 /DNA_END=1381 /DNA_ORIENTATION=-